ncbi:MAG: VOC family protein [Acidobacteria bacterium]|nr:MAG: VOC family protein [Acidobacteriota bacterium]
MSDAQRPEVGAITWFDLTVVNAEEVRDFYSEVVGWRSSPVDMGGYDDFTMLAPASGKAIAGVCHARGGNADLPPQWLIYVTVADVEHSARRCVELGGTVIAGPKTMGNDRYCVIQDPAGAVAALYQHGVQS